MQELAIRTPLKFDDFYKFIIKTFTMLSYEIKTNKDGKPTENEKAYLNELYTLLKNDYKLCNEHLEELYKRIIDKEDAVYRRSAPAFFLKYFNPMKEADNEAIRIYNDNQERMKENERVAEEQKKIKLHEERMEIDPEYRKEQEEKEKKQNEIINNMKLKTF